MTKTKKRFKKVVKYNLNEDKTNMISYILLLLLGVWVVYLPIYNFMKLSFIGILTWLVLSTVVSIIRHSRKVHWEEIKNDKKKN